MYYTQSRKSLYIITILMKMIFWEVRGAQSRKSLFIIIILMKKIFWGVRGAQLVCCMYVCLSFCVGMHFFLIFQNTKCKPANSAEFPNPVSTKNKTIYSLAFVYFIMMAHWIVRNLRSAANLAYLFLVLIIDAVVIGGGLVLFGQVLIIDAVVIGAAVSLSSDWVFQLWRLRTSQTTTAQ